MIDYEATQNFAEKQVIIDMATSRLTQSYLKNMPLEYRGREGPASKESILRAIPVSLDTLPILNDPILLSGGRTLPKEYATHSVIYQPSRYSCNSSYCMR